MADFSNISELLKGMNKFPPVDKEALMASHRKNLDALTEANKTAIEVMKSITQLQKEYLKQTFEDLKTSFKEKVQTVNPKEMASNHASHLKSHVSKAMEHGNTLASTLGQSHKQIMEILRNRFSEGAQETKDLIQRKKPH